MAGFYQEGDYDVAGFAVGIVDRKKLITGETISEGDVILGIPSTGIHSNGYSLVRKLAKENHWDLKKVYPDFDKSLGEVLLTPTRLYPKVVLPLLSHIDIKGMVHITGGGFYENIPRILPEGTAVVIDGDSWPVLPIFPFLKKEGNIDAHEMYRTFNCGIGMLLILNQEDADKAMDILSEQGEKIYRIGYVTKGKKEVTITGGLFHE